MRYPFVDGLRGVAIILMIINHTGRYWLSAGFFRHELIYLTMTWSAPLFLYLVGFSLVLSFNKAQAKRASKSSMIGKYLVRGVSLVGFGFLLSLMLNHPVFQGNILHTIGLSIILAIPFLLLKQNWLMQLVMLGLIVTCFGGLSYEYIVMQTLSDHLPSLSLYFLSSFPLIPYFCFVLLGILLAEWFVNCQTKKLNMYWTLVCLMGVGLVHAFMLNQVFFDSTPWLSFANDNYLNDHWFPKPDTMLWVVGCILLYAFGLYYAYVITSKHLKWLSLLGRNALLIYFVHYGLVKVVVSDWWQYQETNWWLYILTTLILTCCMLGVSYLWLVIQKKDVNYFAN